MSYFTVISFNLFVLFNSDLLLWCSSSGTVSSITDTSMASPKCGREVTHSLPSGIGMSFFCRPSLNGRYVTIRDVRGGESEFNLCEVEVYSEQRGMAYLDILKNYS